jgi:chromate reductase
MPDAVTALQAAIAQADAVVVATPEYNYSVSGVLKNAIDWISRTQPQPFINKPVGIIGASMGALGTARAQYDLRKIFVFLDAHVLNKPEVMIGAAHTRFDAAGKLTDEATRGFLAAMLLALRDWTVRLRGP